jgi:hypothetical protein
MTEPAYILSDDEMTLVIRRRVPGGVQNVTLHRQDGAGPFTAADVAFALSEAPRSGHRMQPGQRNRTRRVVTRFGTVWTHVMTGPPTWRLPRLKRERDGTVMAGWLRLAVAVKVDRSDRVDRRPADNRELARTPSLAAEAEEWLKAMGRGQP